MKYLVLLTDGLSDRPIDKLGGKTIMQVAKTPNLDRLAKEGIAGFIHTTPEGMPPGSDICNLSIFGYDPRKYYTGRSPLEALSIGVDLGANDIAMRCNFVTIKDDVMDSFSAHHISNENGKYIIDELNKIFKDDNIMFYQGVSYRNLMVVKDRSLDIVTTPPHDITDQFVLSHFPKGKDADFLLDIIERSKPIFEGNDKVGKASSIWLWGEGSRPNLPTYKDMFNLTGSVISAVDLLRGIGVSAGLDIIEVPDITGLVDTNFKGKAEYGIDSLKDKDYVFIHLEAPDEAGHLGDIDMKIKSIELIDEIMLPIIIDGMKKFKDYRVMVTPDHPTPVELKTHVNDKVPAIVWGSGIKPDENVSYDESIKPSFEFTDGYKVAEFFIKG